VIDAEFIPDNTTDFGITLNITGRMFMTMTTNNTHSNQLYAHKVAIDILNDNFTMVMLKREDAASTGKDTFLVT